jgi:hypothetical protein
MKKIPLKRPKFWSATSVTNPKVSVDGIGGFEKVSEVSVKAGDE